MTPNTKKLLRVALPAAAAAALIGYLTNWMGLLTPEHPFVRPEGTGVAVQPADPGRAYAPEPAVRAAVVTLPGPSIRGAGGVSGALGTVGAGAGSSAAVDVKPLALPPASPIALQRPTVETSSAGRREGGKVEDDGEYVHRLLEMARAGRWEDLGREIAAVGGEAGAVATAAPALVDVPGLMPFEFAGALTPADDPADLQGQLKRSGYPEFGPPLVKVASLKGDWRRAYDATFAALRAQDRPIAGVCLARMSVAELLRIPEFVRAYGGRVAAIVPNLDLTTESFGIEVKAADVARGAQRVALALELIHRAGGASKVWLAVGFNRQPAWEAWVAAQDGSRFRGLALCGHTAWGMCQEPLLAAWMARQFAAGTPGRPLAMIGMSGPRVNGSLVSKDAAGDWPHRGLVDGFKSAKFSWVHFEER